jgi:hypothetical protein
LQLPFRQPLEDIHFFQPIDADHFPPAGLKLLFETSDKIFHEIPSSIKELAEFPPVGAGDFHAQVGDVAHKDFVKELDF